MTNMVDIITKIIGKQKIAAITPADLGIVMVGGVTGFVVDTIARASPQVPPGWIDLLGLIISGAGAFYLKQPWNTLSAGIATGITVGGLRIQANNTARMFMARANGIANENGKARKMTPDTHMGMTTFNERAPNSPFVGMIQPNVIYTTGAAGYSQGMANSGLSTSSSIKAPIGNGSRYTV